MFTKLLKYDNLAVWKYWWIAALCSLPLAAIGGVCMMIENADYTKYNALQTIAVPVLVLAILGLFLLPVLTEILVFMRFYKHFFTDEGYLTFTLPVKKTTLLNSKIVSALLFSVMGIVVLAADIFIMLAIGSPDDVFNARTWSNLFDGIKDFYTEYGGYGVVYTLQGILIVLALIAVSMLSFFVCITLANMITKKLKVLTAVGFYYGANVVVTVLLQILSMSGVFNVFEKLDSLDTTSMYTVIAAILFVVLGVLAVVIAGLYLLELYLLDKRLNLE